MIPIENLLFCLKSLLLGIVEGITEFLPISSTGHLIVFENLLGFHGSEQYINTYSYVIQLGAILAVIVLYRKKILATLQNLFPKRENGRWTRPYAQTGLRFWITLAIACIPGFVGVMLFGSPGGQISVQRCQRLRGIGAGRCGHDSGGEVLP